jgi:hypothetical protein
MATPDTDQTVDSARVAEVRSTILSLIRLIAARVVRQLAATPATPAPQPSNRRRTRQRPRRGADNETNPRDHGH